MTEVSWFSVPCYATSWITFTCGDYIRRWRLHTRLCRDLIMQATACIIRPLDTNNRKLHFAITHNLPPSDEGGVTKWRRERVAKCSYISCKQEVILPSAVILASPVILLTLFAVKDEIALRWNLHYVQVKSLCDEILLRRVMLVGRWACSRRKKPQRRAWRPRHAEIKPQLSCGCKSGEWCKLLLA